MDKVPIWLLAILFLYGTAMLTYAIFIGRCVDLWPPKIGAICVPEPEPQESQKWYGHFIDLNNKTGEPKIYDEEWALKIDASGNMSAKAEAMQDGKKKYWEYKGFKVGKYLVGSYKAINNNSGVGVLFLEERDSLLIGRWTGKTCNGEMVITCPYILSKLDGIALNTLNQKLLEAGCKVYKPKTMILSEMTTNVTCDQ